MNRNITGLDNWLGLAPHLWRSAGMWTSGMGPIFGFGLLGSFGFLFPLPLVGFGCAYRWFLVAVGPFWVSIPAGLSATAELVALWGLMGAYCDPCAIVVAAGSVASILLPLVRCFFLCWLC